MTVAHIMTKSNVTAQAMQFEGTQANADEILEWINNHDPSVVVEWTGWDAFVDDKGKKHSGLTGQLLLRTPGMEGFQECHSGDWVLKSSRDTFYTVPQDLFDETWVVMH